MNQEITKLTEKPPFDRSSSQDSLGEVSMEDYWAELENIKKSNENRQGDQEVVVVKEPDGKNKLNKSFFASVCIHEYMERKRTKKY